MTLVKCPNGHYYDASRFGNNCPHCGMSGVPASNGDSTTVPMTVPGGMDAGDVTMPLDVTTPNTAPVAPAPAPVAPAPAPVAPAPAPVAPAPAPVAPAPAPVAPAPVPAPESITIPEKEDKTLPVTADMLTGDVGAATPVVGWLVCTGGVNKGCDYRLHQGRNFIGRSMEMDVCLMGDNTVSRSSHAVVVYDPRGNVYLAQPGESKELLYINDKLVLNTVELKPMDILSLGDTKLMFVPLCGEAFHW